MPDKIPDKNADRQTHSARSKSSRDESAHQFFEAKTDSLINGQGKADKDTQVGRKSILQRTVHPEASRSPENLQAKTNHLSDYPEADPMTVGKAIAAAQPWTDSAAVGSKGLNNSSHNHTDIVYLEKRSVPSPITRHNMARGAMSSDDVGIVKNATREQLDHLSDQMKDVSKRDDEVVVEKALPKEQQSDNHEIRSDPDSLSIDFGKECVASNTSDDISGSETSNTSREPQDDLLRKEPGSIGHYNSDRWSGLSEKVRLEMDANRLNFTGQDSGRDLTVTGPTNEEQCKKQLNQEGVLIATPITTNETLMHERETENESPGDFTAAQREISPHRATKDIPNTDTDPYSKTEKGNLSASYIPLFIIGWQDF